MPTLITLLLWVMALGCGLMAGIYFAFSVFIMSAFDRAGLATGIAAMNSINVAILKSAFLPLFFLTSLGALVLAAAALLTWEGQASLLIVGGALIYFIGMTVVTVVFNVPLNNELAAIDPGSPQAADVWLRYLTTWTPWNHVRTVASTLAFAAFIAALNLR